MLRIVTDGWIPNPAADFGARLALVRQGWAWNIRAAATACGIDPESWRAWETQGRKPRDFQQVCRRFAARAYAADRDVRTVQSLLGHTSLETTQRYLAVSMDDRRKAAAAAA